VTDLRLLPSLAAVWAGSIAGARLPRDAWIAVAAVLLGVSVVSAMRPRLQARWIIAAACLCGAAAVLGAGARTEVRKDDLLGRLAARGAEVSLDVVVTGDPVRLDGSVLGAHRVSGGLLVPVRAEVIAIGPAVTRIRHPVTVLATDKGWLGRLPGDRLRLAARLGPPRRHQPVAAIARAHGPPVLLGRAGAVQRLAGRLRAGLRDAADDVPADARGLLPGLVIGDTSRLPDDLREDFLVTGMTHLVAVSGSNAAIILGLALLLARRAGASVGMSAGLGGLALVFFVVLARPSPSVLRAAAMGGIGLMAMVTGRGRAGLPALAGAALVLVLLDPGLALSAGFALSSAATAGLILLAPRWRARLAQKWPGWLADAVAVPLAAQVACLPVIVGLFGEVSLVAVPANLLAIPAVGVATVAGVATALIAPLSLPLARVVAWAAAVPALWLAWVARTFAEVPGARVSWPSGVVGAVAMTMTLCATPWVCRRRTPRRVVATSAAAALLAVVTARAVLPGWPPSGWQLAVCDVGQGDGMVVRGRSAVLVVDTGPEPEAMRDCLDDLGVGDVSSLVLTHLHADHVEGVPGALQGRTVAEIVTGPLDEPAEEWSRVRRWASGRQVSIRRAGAGERWMVGDIAVTVLGPAAPFRGTSSDPNNSSLVLAVQVGGTRMLLTGDIEQPAQRAVLAAASPEQLRADVLKTAHHGSSRQVEEFAATVGASVAVTSVGADNPYGHPAPATMTALRGLGLRSFRTDQHGDVVVGRGRDASLFGAARRRGPPQRASAAESMFTLARRVRSPSLFCPVARAPPAAACDPGRVSIAPLTLITGDEELLVTRAVSKIVAAARAVDRDVDVRDLDAASLDPASLLDLATPSLFGEQRVVVVRLDAKLDDEVRDAILAFLPLAGAELALVVVHPGGNTGKRIVDACKAAGAVAVSCSGTSGLKGMKLADYVQGFVRSEMEELGYRLPAAAAAALIDAVGSDLRELAAACAQLCADVGGAVDEAAVRRYFSGRAEVTGFDLADRATEGNVAAALVELRLALQGGLDPVLVVSALSRQLRTVARVASAGRGTPDDLGRRLGIHPFAVKKAQKQARGWSPESLTAAHEVVAVADEEVKGGGTDPVFAVERAVRQVAELGAGR